MSLSAYINLKCDTEKVSGDDWFAYANACMSVVLYLMFTIAIGYAIIECLRIIYGALLMGTDVFDDLAEDDTCKNFDIITKDLDMRKKTCILYPLAFLADR